MSKDDKEPHEEKSPEVNLPLLLHGKEFPVEEDEGAFSNFFLNKMSKNLKEKHPDAEYDLEKNEKGQVTSVTWRNISEAQRKELEDALDWSLRKVEENRRADIS